MVDLICPTLVETGLTDLPKFGDAMAPPAPPGTTDLKCNITAVANIKLKKKVILSYNKFDFHSTDISSIWNL